MYVTGAIKRIGEDFGDARTANRGDALQFVGTAGVAAWAARGEIEIGLGSDPHGHVGEILAGND